MQKEEEKDGAPIRVIPEWFWKASLTFTGVLTVAILYFLGYAFHASWLKFFHLDISVYPLAREEYLMYGAAAFFQTGVAMGEWSGQHKWPIVGMFLYFTFWNALFTAGEYFGSRRQKQKMQPGRRRSESRHPHIGKFFLRNVMVVCFMTLFLLGIPLTGAMLTLPGSIGTTVGLIVARRDAEGIGKGCTKAPMPCVSLKKDEKEIAEGFRIAQSKDRIALYVNGATSEYLLDGLTWSTIDYLH
ncbi:hypothetical protein [Paraburkholderia tropica]|uniref:hypothetical protein n=1 Tax=Paraburkholderia tropica TaxID=92647 RepID=UPI002AB1343F|nr:hypothetical protein [Paraburkholderia tropica]